MNRKGFTLIELSIVIVIIGFLIGAIVKGTALIDTARAKRVLTDVTTLADAQNTYYERTGSYAGDNSNDGAIDFQTLGGASLDDSAATPNDADYPFIALKNVKLLGDESDSILSHTQYNGYLYFAGSAVTDSAGNTSPVNMIVIRGVKCEAAYQMELNVDNDDPSDTNSAATGRVRAISSGALVTSGTWNAANLCAGSSKTTVSIAYMLSK